jgi:hypothetical protein
MKFIPVKRCNPYLSRRIGDVVGYIAHEYYNEILDAVFSGTVESWSDLPSNVQDIILAAENTRRIAIEQHDIARKATLQRLDDIKNQLTDLKTQLESEKSDKIIQRNKSLNDSKNHLLNLRNLVEVSNV